MKEYTDSLFEQMYGAKLQDTNTSAFKNNLLDSNIESVENNINVMD